MFKIISAAVPNSKRFFWIYTPVADVAAVKLDDYKLVPVPVNLNKLSDLVRNDVDKKTKYDKLVKKANIIETTDTSNLFKKADYNEKTGEIEPKILDHYYDKDITIQNFTS